MCMSASTPPSHSADGHILGWHFLDGVILVGRIRLVVVIPVQAAFSHMAKISFGGREIH